MLPLRSDADTANTRTAAATTTRAHTTAHATSAERRVHQLLRWHVGRVQGAE